MPEPDLEVRVDKFVFRVKPGLRYAHDGIWLDLDETEGLIRIGLTDYRQQSSGDAVFVNLPAAGQVVEQGDDLANIETIKVDLAVPAPFGGEIVATNGALADAPELVNQDPYGAGWLVDLRPDAWPVAGLLDADAYLAVMSMQAEEANR